MAVQRDLRDGIYRALASSQEIKASLGGLALYEDAPQSAPFPYLTIGQTTDRDWATGESKAGEHTVTLHVWSRVGGRQRTQEIMEHVRSALSRTPITIAGIQKVQLQHEFSEARHDEDGETFHGIVRYKAFTEPFG